MDAFFPLLKALGLPKDKLLVIAQSLHTMLHAEVAQMIPLAVANAVRSETALMQVHLAEAAATLNVSRTPMEMQKQIDDMEKTIAHQQMLIDKLRHDLNHMFLDNFLDEKCPYCGASNPVAFRGTCPQCSDA